MNVGSIGNNSYMGYIRPAEKPGSVSMQHAPQTAPVGSPQNTPQISPQTMPQFNLPSVTPSNPYMQVPSIPTVMQYNFDGDSAQFRFPINISMQPDAPSTERIAPLEPNGECHTCANRKYVDGSDDSSVSFQTPTKISPNMAAAAVASHENEHVRNEQAKAARDGREIISQTVTLTYDCCPECGKNYVSGGTTRTTSIDRGESDSPVDSAQASAQGSGDN
ncbi:MAG: hypothetical protein FWD44_02220 [Oscillospiraceae bacterium]|nr:hypothetical protein [Oscillospiraceae bacterium]